MGHLTPIIGLRLLALAAGLRHNAEIGQPGLCFSAYGHKFGITIWRLKACRTEAAMVERVRPDVNLPGGTVTFLFTDIEGSTRLLQELGDGYGQVVADHRRLLRDVFATAGGHEVDTQGDAFFYSFPRAKDAVRGAVEGQRALGAHSWPGGAQVRVRMGLHTGEPTVGDEGYVGMDVVRAARICSAGHGGQILMSETTRALLGTALPDRTTLRDLGLQSLKDVGEERIFQLALDGRDD